MNKDFQDIIDEYLLHGDTMSEEAKAQFLKEIDEDAEKREQYELTKNVMEAIVSRGEKLKAMAEFQKELDMHTSTSEAKPSWHGKAWLWISGIAAILVVGFFAINPLLNDNATDGNVRGGDDVFNPTTPNDSIANDTTTIDSTAFTHE